MEDKYIYLVAYKEDKNEELHAWFCKEIDAAGKEAADMIKDGGGSAVVVELEPKEIASLLLKDWFKEEE